MSEPIMKIINGTSEAKVYFDPMGISIISGIITVVITHKQLKGYFENVDKLDGGFMTSNSLSETINLIHRGAAMTLSSADFNTLKLKHSKYLEDLSI